VLLCLAVQDWIYLRRCTRVHLDFSHAITSFQTTEDAPPPLTPTSSRDTLIPGPADVHTPPPLPASPFKTRYVVTVAVVLLLHNARVYLRVRAGVWLVCYHHRVPGWLRSRLCFHRPCRSMRRGKRVSARCTVRYQQSRRLDMIMLVNIILY